MAGAVTRSRLDVMSARWLGYTLPVTGAGILGRGCSIERKVKLMEEIIRLQRATVDEHIRQKNAHNRPAVYDTFAPHECAIAVVAFHAQFGELNGIRDFYRVVATAFPDFKTNVWANMIHPAAPFAR
jgi:hypothetical protein